MKNEPPDDQAVMVIYKELRRIATNLMRKERPGHTLQPTALVHEVWPSLFASASKWEDQRHFLRDASRAMRRFLISYARRRNSLKVGGTRIKITLEGDWLLESAHKQLGPDEIEAIVRALEALKEADAQMAEIVDLRFFAGLTHRAIAEALGLSEDLVARRLSVALKWLRRQLKW